jgi:gluconate 2-dehydrogenase gamma chain
VNRREMLRLATVLLGSAVSASMTRGVLAGALPSDQPSRRIFSDEARAMTATLAELIIPKTDTPGALEAGVPHFIELMVTDWYTDTERRLFFAGLADLNGFCTKNYGRDFLSSTPAQHTAALQAAEQQASSYRSSGSGGFRFAGKEPDEHAPFFAKIKELTVLGYYTSQVGATQELVYEPMPMRYDGDYPYSKVRRQFSL